MDGIIAQYYLWSDSTYIIYIKIAKVFSTELCGAA